MWETTLKKGKVKFTETYKHPVTGKWLEVSKTMPNGSAKSRNAANRFLQRRIENILNSLGTSASKDITFLDSLKHFMQFKKDFIKDSTYTSYKTRYRRLNRIVDDTLFLSQLTTGKIQLIINEFYIGRSYSYTLSALNFIKNALKHAKRMGHIESIAFIDDVIVQIPVKTQEDIQKIKDKCLDRDELTDVLDQLSKINRHVALLCEFQALTGLRFGEMIGLRNQDYCPKERIIDINGSLSSHYNSKTKRRERSTPKNVYSYRKVLLCERANAIISEFILYANMIKRINLVDNDYIFVSRSGVPFDLHFVNKIIKKIEYKKAISSHTFRHTHISMLAAKNIPLKAIMERVGHNEPRTTLAVYTHVTDEMRGELKKALEKINHDIV